MNKNFLAVRRIVLAALVVAIAAVSTSQPVPREQVGILPDGSFLLNSGWRVKPAGTQVGLDTLPMASVLSKDGRFLIVLNGGYNPPSHQRSRYQGRARGGPHSREPTPGSAWRFRPTAARCG